MNKCAANLHDEALFRLQLVVTRSMFDCLLKFLVSFPVIIKYLFVVFFFFLPWYIQVWEEVGDEAKKHWTIFGHNLWQIEVP